MLTTGASEFVDRVYRAHLVVGPHHADHGDRGRVLGDGRSDGVLVDAAEIVDVQPGDLGACVVGQPADRVQYGVVFHRRGQDAALGVVGLVAGPVQALDREVVAFRPARGEDHLGRAGAECVRDVLGFELF